VEDTANQRSTIEDLGARLQAALGDAYVVERKLGEGAFAAVFLVRDVQLKRSLAVKVMSPDAIVSHSALERFRREAETVAGLSHPNIVPLYFVGQKDDLVYLVMQAIDGGSLADRIKREGRLPIDEATRILGEVASALAFAHRRGVVHRDIKPQNVLLDVETNRALVTDFGIARTAEAQNASLTATGMMVGTPAYVSPEQVSGEPSDHRVDIYALGVMAYEMLTGDLPFSAPTPMAMLMKRLAEPPPPLRSVRGDVPAALENTISACLATDPNQRVQDASDIVRSLGGDSTGFRIPAQRRRGRSKGLVIGAGVVVVAAAAVALLLRPKTVEAPTVAASPIDSGMATIASGTYVIGSNSVEQARPSHPVQLESFGLDKREVTVGDYAKYLAARNVPAPWTTRPDDALPVTGVRLAEAANYCAWRHPSGGRLPTEAEWEAAARGVEGRAYPWGKEWNASAANVANVRSGPAPVGSYPAGRTPDGVDDLIGNVWEWTSSPYVPYADANGKGTGMFVIRGGGFNAIKEVANPVFRAQADPAADRGNLAATGFRCAMPVRKAAAD